MTRPPLLSPAAVAAEIGVAEKTLRNWRWRGIGPTWVQVGRKPHYRAADLDRWLAHRTQHGAPAAKGRR